MKSPTVVDWKKRLKEAQPKLDTKTLINEAVALAEKVPMALEYFNALTKEEFDAIYKLHIIGEVE